MQNDVLYLGSQSRARRQLLDFAHIDYKILKHASDEILEFQPVQFSAHVMQVAAHKMHTLIMPMRQNVDSDYLYAITADTLIKNMQDNTILGKPQDYGHAIKMLTEERKAPVEVMTGCCLSKFHYQNQNWQLQNSTQWATGALVEFRVDDESIQKYLSTFPFVLQCSGAGVIEDHGLSYLKSIQGSYTAVLGLPLYELRLALKEMGFKF